MSQGNLNLKRLLPVPSLKEMALSAIKEAMLAKKLEPETMYTEAALTKELGISRTPVREALIHLASRGLIVYYPRRGFKVRLMKEKDVRDLFELRLVLELAVIRHITHDMTNHSLAAIETAWNQYRKGVRKGNPVESIHANRDFHNRLARLTENDYLINALDEIRDLSDLAGVRSLEDDSRTLEATVEHERIYKELKRKSIDGALKQMEIHIRTTEERVLARIQKTKMRDKVS
jgi:DNA-binding GntR family transcriptional regulator